MQNLLLLISMIKEIVSKFLCPINWYCMCSDCDHVSDIWLWVLGLLLTGPVCCQGVSRCHLCKCRNSMTGILNHYSPQGDQTLLIHLGQTKWLKRDLNSQPMAMRANALTNWATQTLGQCRYLNSCKALQLRARISHRSPRFSFWNHRIRPRNATIAEVQVSLKPLRLT